jgi:hypothetical protein
MTRTPLLILMMVAVAVVGCSDSSKTTSTAVPAASTVGSALTATSTAGPVKHAGATLTFENGSLLPTEIPLKRDRPTDVSIKNNDPGPHSLTVFEGTDFSRRFITFPEIGPGTTANLLLPILPAGKYAYRDDQHPELHGVIVVTE